MKIASKLKKKIAVILVTAGAAAYTCAHAGVITTTDFSGLQLTTSTQTNTNQSSKPAFETIRGNGTKAGYVLGHGSVIPGSESVTVNGSKKKRGKDYVIDNASGTLMFQEAVSTSQAIRVSYRYAEGDNGERTLVGLPGMSIASSKNLSMNLTYAYRVSDKSGNGIKSDLVTYGISTTTKLGVNSKLNSLMYASSPQESSAVIDEFAVRDGNTPAKQEEAKSGRMMVQDADLNFGKLNVKLGYQDVSKDFNGFTALKDSKAAPEELLKQLEKEKGLKRMNLQTSLAAGKGTTVSAGFDQVKDSDDDITSQSFEITTGKIKATLNTRQVGTNFNRFKDIREADRDQLAKEKGIKRTNMGLQFGANGANGLSIGSIKDKTGEISTKVLGYTSEFFDVSIYKRSVDQGFARLGDLSSQDRTEMALAVKQQFDPNAKAEHVNDKDRAAVSNEAGIERSNIRASFKTGSVNNSVQVLNISDGGDQIKRNVVNFAGKDWNVTWMNQSIGEKFGKLQQLAPVEQGAFGNEYGMNRQMFSGTGKLGATNVGLSFSKVSDGEGSATKQSLSLQGKNFNVRANIQDIDPTFKRSMDLVDPDRKQMAEGTGYKKTDISANFKVSDSIGVESFYMRAQNDTEHKDKDQLRNKITFTPNAGTKITLFRDQFSFKSDEGNISSYTRQTFGLDQKIGSLQFKGFRDTNTVENGSNPEQTTTTTSMHLESDKKAKTFFTADSKKIDFGDGRSENTRAFSIVSRPMGTLMLKSSMLDISREGGADESMRNFGFEWSIRKDLKATADVTKKDVENAGETNITAYSIAGTIANNLIGLKDVKGSASFSKESTNGQTNKENNAVNVEAKAFGGSVTWQLHQGRAGDGNPTSRRGFKFVSDRDPKKRLHFDLGYTRRDLGAGDPILIRSMNMDMKINSRTRLTYNYFTYIEKPDGNIDDKGGSVIKLTTALNKKLNLAAEYGTADCYGNHTTGIKMALGIVGTLSNGAAIELYFGMNDLSGPAGKDTGHTYKVKYDRQVDADHYLTFTGTLQTHKDRNPATADKSEVECRLDFRTVFH